jgi:hypothetical protein
MMPCIIMHLNLHDFNRELYGLWMTTSQHWLGGDAREWSSRPFALTSNLHNMPIIIKV